MTHALTHITKAEQALANAKTPIQSKAVESLAAAAKAWAKEQGDYEMLVNASHLYILARRKTTELILPNIHSGRPNGNEGVTILKDYGFTKMQWSRRVQELRVAANVIDEYLDTCIERGWTPTVYGMISHANNPEPSVVSTERRELQRRFAPYLWRASYELLGLKRNRKEADRLLANYQRLVEEERE